MKKKKQILSIFTMSLSCSLEWTLKPSYSVAQVSLYLYIKRTNTWQQISKIWKAETELFNMTELEVNKIICLWKSHFAVQTVITACVNQPMYCFFSFFFFSLMFYLVFLSSLNKRISFFLWISLQDYFHPKTKFWGIFQSTLWPMVNK